MVLSLSIVATTISPPQVLDVMYSRYYSVRDGSVFYSSDDDKCLAGSDTTEYYESIVLL